MVGDLAGFAAATYLRGIKLVQIPTTLLACVDSSVGGKTAVDLPTGKNLLGAFYQPHVVLIDPDNLSTLTNDIFLDGAAEAIKYAAIMDADMYPLCADMHANIDEIIIMCAAIAVIFIAVWTFNAFSYRQQEKELTDKLREFNENLDDE